MSMCHVVLVVDVVYVLKHDDVLLHALGNPDLIKYPERKLNIVMFRTNVATHGNNIWIWDTSHP